MAFSHINSESISINCPPYIIIAVINVFIIFIFIIRNDASSTIAFQRYLSKPYISFVGYIFYNPCSN